MDAFWLSLGLVFLAELGDKTQLVALTLATRFQAATVLWGVFVATLLVHLLSVGLGGAAGAFLPVGWLELASGLAFVGFGAWTLRGDTLEEEEGRMKRFTSPFLVVAVTFFVAELGDKTMLSTVTLAAGHATVPVWLGSTLGMVLSDGLAIWVGVVLGRKLPERAVKLGAAAIFFAFGLLYIYWGCVPLLADAASLAPVSRGIP